MELFITHALLLVVLFALAILNAYAGFLGTIFGEYRMRRKSESPIRFCILLEEKTDEFFRAYVQGDVSCLAAVLVFMHIGIVLLFLIAFGPVGQDKIAESRIQLK